MKVCIATPTSIAGYIKCHLRSGTRLSVSFTVTAKQLLRVNSETATGEYCIEPGGFIELTHRLRLRRY